MWQALVQFREVMGGVVGCKQSPTPGLSTQNALTHLQTRKNNVVVLWLSPPTRTRPLSLAVLLPPCASWPLDLLNLLRRRTGDPQLPATGAVAAAQQPSTNVYAFFLWLVREHIAEYLMCHSTASSPWRNKQTTTAAEHRPPMGRRISWKVPS